MKNITKDSIREDLNTIQELFGKYSDAIYENQEGQPAHFDNQLKLVRICMSDVRAGLYLADQALHMLNNLEIIEDETV